VFVPSDSDDHVCHVQTLSYITTMSVPITSSLAAATARSKSSASRRRYRQQMKQQAVAVAPEIKGNPTPSSLSLTSTTLSTSSISISLRYGMSPLLLPSTELQLASAPELKRGPSLSSSLSSFSLSSSSSSSLPPPPISVTAPNKRSPLASSSMGFPYPSPTRGPPMSSDSKRNLLGSPPPPLLRTPSSAALIVGISASAGLFGRLPIDVQTMIFMHLWMKEIVHLGATSHGGQHLLMVYLERTTVLDFAAAHGQVPPRYLLATRRLQNVVCVAN
jgi:hypothetical protein